MSTFLLSERGAVAVDYVTVTAGLAGLGFAVATTMSPAINSGVQDIVDSITGGASGVLRLLIGGIEFEDFTGGDLGIWDSDLSAVTLSSGSTEDVLTLSNGTEPAQSVSTTFELDPAADTVQGSFDFVMVDYGQGNQNDNVYLYVNDTVVGSVHAFGSYGATHYTVTTTDENGDPYSSYGVSFVQTTTETYGGVTNLAGAGHSNDQIRTYEFEITGLEGGTTYDIGFGGSTNLATNYGTDRLHIDNISLSAAGGL